MRATEAFTQNFVAAGSSPVFTVQGGTYELAAHSGSWSAGNLTLNQLLPDGVTFFATPLTLTADGRIQGNLAPGQYKLVLTTTAQCNAALARVPVE